MESNAVLRLTETDGGGNSSELPPVTASESVITIGRSHASDRCFGENDQSVSRQQFELSFSGGEPMLKNAGRNPVLYRNGKKQLAPDAQVKIESGLEFSFRESRLRFEVEVPAVYLLKTKGAGGRAEFEVEAGRKYTVGRSPECDITFNSSGVSRRHCRIQLEAGDVLKIHDLGSVNGVRLFTDGEVQEECPDIEAPCGVKFIIGDIECILEKQGQHPGKKKVPVLPIVLVLVLAAAGGAYVLLRPAAAGGQPEAAQNAAPEKTESMPEPAEAAAAAVEKQAGRPPEKSAEELEQERLAAAALERSRQTEQIQALIRANQPYSKKAERFAGLAENAPLKSLRPVYQQMADYYGQCRKVEMLTDVAAKQYNQQKTATRKAIEQMRFDFESSLSFKRLQSEAAALQTSHKAAAELLKEDGIEAPEFPRDLKDEAAVLVEKADVYGEKARSLLFIWTDLENSAFDAGKFDREVMMASIDTLYPDEGIGADVCAVIDEIVNYQQQMDAAFAGLVGQVEAVVQHCRSGGVSEELVPKRLDMKPLREALETPRPDYFKAAPPITAAAKILYDFLEGISVKYSNLEFLTYCGAQQSLLEQKQEAYEGMTAVLPLMQQLCVEASAQSAADLDEGQEPYRIINGRLESGEALGFNDANKLIHVYDLCHQYLQHELFCGLQEESAKKAAAVSDDCLEALYVRLRKECDDGLMAMNADEKEVAVQNAKRILEILDSAVELAEEFKTKIQDDRKWVEDSAAGS